MELDQVTKDAVSKLIAQQILAGIGTEHRDAILAKSIEGALRDWSVKSSIEKVVAAEASVVVVEILKDRQYQDMIASICEDALREYLVEMRSAVKNSIDEFFLGRDGDTYNRAPSPLLRAIVAARKEAGK